MQRLAAKSLNRIAEARMLTDMQPPQLAPAQHVRQGNLVQAAQLDTLQLFLPAGLRCTASVPGCLSVLLVDALFAFPAACGVPVSGIPLSVAGAVQGLPANHRAAGQGPAPGAAGGQFVPLLCIGRTAPHASCSFCGVACSIRKEQELLSHPSSALPTGASA